MGAKISSDKASQRYDKIFMCENSFRDGAKYLRADIFHAHAQG